MPLVSEWKQQRGGKWLALAVFLPASWLVGALAWSWIVAAVRAPLGGRTVAFGRLFTSKRRPPPGHRPIGMLGNPKAVTRFFRLGDNVYFVGCR